MILCKELPANFYASDWTYTHGNLFSAIQMEKAMVSLLLFLIVLVAAFNIVSSLVMVVTDKKSDIAILGTLGCITCDRLPKFLWCKVRLLGLLARFQGCDSRGLSSPLVLVAVWHWLNNVIRV